MRENTINVFNEHSVLCQFVLEAFTLTAFCIFQDARYTVVSTH